MGLAATAIADGLAVASDAPTDALDNAYTQAAMEYMRAFILAVPGVGPVRGVQEYNADVYAFRDNAGQTACVMHKATAAGWEEQDLGSRIPFTDAGAGVEYVEGEIITGAVSGAYATISRVVRQSGTWGTDAAGYFIVGDITNGPFQAEATTGDIAGVVPIDSAEIATTLLPGGRYEFDNYNFYGTSGTYRMYGADGVNPCFEWDGSVYVPILTGNTNDSPSHVKAHKFHLMLCFEKGSLQNSATGNPYIWAGGGANEIGTGEELVGIEVEVGNTLAVMCRNRTRMLYGSNTVEDPWDLKTISNEAGGIEWTMQRMGETKYLDDRGMTTLEAVQDFGDFKAGVFSQLIEPLILAKKTNVVSSMIVKSKNQYRLFFNDGSGISATFDNNEIKGFTEFEYYYGASLPIVANCTANGEDENGAEIMFIGGDNGFVYQVDKGTSMDGDAVEAFIRFSFSHMGSPQDIKRFLKAVFEVTATDNTTISFTPDFDYSARDDITQDLTVKASGGFWNIDNWNEFVWSGAAVNAPEAYLDGSGKNIGLSIYHESTYDEPYILHGATVHYEHRRRER